MIIKPLAAGAVVALALSACANSNSSTVPGHRAAIGPATPAATGEPASGGGSAASAQRSTMTISIVLPPKKEAAGNRRAPKTVSPGIAYLDVVLQSLNGDAQPVTGPYTILIPASQLSNCGTRAGNSRTSSVHTSAVFLPPPGCTASVVAPVGNAVYAVGALDSTSTLLDYAENVPVTVPSTGTATLAATLNGVGSAVTGYTMLTDPARTTSYRLQYGVDCPADDVQYDAKAVCSFGFDVDDFSGSDMALTAQSPNGAHLANALAFTVTDLTTQQPLTIGYDTTQPDPTAPAQEIDFDPNMPTGGGLTGVVLNAGRLGRYSSVIHPDLTEIPANATDTVEFKAVLAPASTAAFGTSVALPNAGAVTFTWDLACKNVTVGPNDPSGVADGSALQFCEPQESGVHVVVQ